jgi:hypothetical protein
MDRDPVEIAIGGRVEVGFVVEVDRFTVGVGVWWTDVITSNKSQHVNLQVTPDRIRT